MIDETERSRRIVEAAVRLIARQRKIWWGEGHEDFDAGQLLNELDDAVGELAPPQTYEPAGAKL